MSEGNDNVRGPRSRENQETPLKLIDQNAAKIIARYAGNAALEKEAAVVAKNIEDRADLEYCAAFLTSLEEMFSSNNKGPYLAVARKWQELRSGKQER